MSRQDTGMMNFSEALEKFKKGECIAVFQWPEHEFVSLDKGIAPADEIERSIKDDTTFFGIESALYNSGDIPETYRNPQVVYHYASGRTLPGYTFQTADVLSNYWYVLTPEQVARKTSWGTYVELAKKMKAEGKI